MPAFFVKIPETMSIDIIRLQTDGVYESEITLSGLSGDMDAIARLGEEWRKTRTKLRWASFIALLLGFPVLGMGPLFFGVMFIALGIGGFVYAYRYRRGVITHLQRCQMVKSVAAMLADDTDAKTAVTLKVALQSQRKLLREADWPARKNGKEKFYSEAWLTLEARLLDGTRFSESISDLVRVRTYVNPRGKSKTKTRVHHIVAMRFNYPRNVYGDLRPAGAKLKDPIHLPETAKVKGMIITDRDIKVKATVNKTEDLGKSCSMLALGVYRLLNLGRKLTVLQGGAH
jgi:hypothetical protein